MTYNQTTGEIRKDGILIGVGYSGHANGLNNPELEAIANIGPVPCGWWTIGSPFLHPKCGPYTMRLIPDKDTATFNRDGFLIHGDSKEFPGQELASDGCIVAPPNVRSRIWQSSDHRLQVVSGLTAPDVTGEISV